MYTVEKNQFISVEELFRDLITEMETNGFDVVWHNGTTDLTDATKATLEAGLASDPLQATQPWRIQFDALVPGGQIVAGTPLQLNDTGECVTKTDGSTVPNTNASGNADISGYLGDNVIDPAKIHAASPWSYRLTTSDRGFTVEAWQNADVTEKNHIWICIQRLVSPVHGGTFLTGHSPIFALCSFDGGSSIKKMTVREKDVYAPSDLAIITQNVDYHASVINSFKQISMSENNQYYVTFPSSFNTTRHVYNEEMDLVAYTSAGVLSQWNFAQINVYGYAQIEFETGATEPQVGDLIQGATSGANGIVREVELTSGLWDGTATGIIKVHSISGDFQADEDLLISAATVAHTLVAGEGSKLEYRTYIGGNANVNSAEGMRLLLLYEADKVLE